MLTENNKLLSGSSDGTVHVWDCLTAKCAHINVGAEVGSIISVGAWVFVGMPNVVKVSSDQNFFFAFFFLFWFCCHCFHVSFGSAAFSIWHVMLLQVWNTGSGAEYNLDGPAGQVYAMAVTTTDKFFAGGQVIIFFVFQLLFFSVNF